MKKTALSALFLIMCLGLTAQDEQVKQFRPSKNNFTVEVNFNPFNSATPIFINGFRGRYFLNDKIAIRTGFNIDYTKKHAEVPETYSGAIYYSTTDESYTTLGVSTGFEYHFLKTKRFSPYFGLIVGYENKTSSSTYNNVNSDYPDYTVDVTDIKNAWQQTYLIEYGGGYYQVVTDISERGYSKLSANVVMGADFYPFQHFYLGLELGFGYNAIFYKEAIYNLNGVFEKKYPKANDSNVGINVNNAIRVGYWF
jgi:hypothetical protein